MRRLRRWIYNFVHGLGQMLWSMVCGTIFHNGLRILAVAPDYVMRNVGVVDCPRVVRCRIYVRGNFRDADVVWAHPVRKPAAHEPSTIVVRFVDRGVTWCYGWRDEDEKALHVLAALENSR